MKSEWLPTHDAQLRDLWAAGYSTAEIGRQMQRTKNSVVGRAHRLDLPARQSPIIATDRRVYVKVRQPDSAMAWKLAHGTRLFGERSASCRYRASQVDAIRIAAAKGLSHELIASILDTSVSTIGRIVRREARVHG